MMYFDFTLYVHERLVTHTYTCNCHVVNVELDQTHNNIFIFTKNINITAAIVLTISCC